MTGLKQRLKFLMMALICVGSVGAASAETFTVPTGGAPFLDPAGLPVPLSASVFPASSSLGATICLHNSSCFDANFDAVIFDIHVGDGPLGPLHVELLGFTPIGAGYFTGAGEVPTAALPSGQGTSFDIELASGQNSVSMFVSFPTGSFSGGETLRLSLGTFEEEMHPHHGHHSSGHSDSDNDSDSDSDSDSDGDSDFGFGDGMLIAEINIVPLVVPEPGTFLLLSAGLLATAWIRRR